MLSFRAEGIGLQRNREWLFENFSFHTASFRRIALMGSTGSGKTTLLKMLAGLIQPDAGRIWVGESRVLGPNEKLIAGHQLVGYLSQHYELRNNYFVWELLEMSNVLGEERKREVISCCSVGNLLERRTDALSGGERQRVALARMLLADPKWLLLDEPFSNLDLVQKRSIMQLLQEIEKKLAVALIVVSHDASDLLGWAEQLVILEKGKVLQEGLPSLLYHQPLNEKVAGLLGEYNLVNKQIAELLTQSAFSNKEDQPFMIRPENIFIALNENGVEGVVTDCVFKGAIKLITCRIKDHGLLQIIVPSTVFIHIGQILKLRTEPAYCFPIHS